MKPSGTYIDGNFSIVMPDLHVEDGIAIKLRIINISQSALLVVIPNVHSNSVTFAVKSENRYEESDRMSMPEDGLTELTRIEPGSSHNKTYDLSQRVRLQLPGDYVLSCSVTLSIFEAEASGANPFEAIVENDIHLKLAP